ncbi:MAG: hypothetical protein AABX13_04485 [Nanoarchaeota archaeon]
MKNDPKKRLEERVGGTGVDVHELVGRIAWDAAARYDDPEQVGRVAWAAAGYGQALERLQAVGERARERLRNLQDKYREQEMVVMKRMQAGDRYDSLYSKAESIYQWAVIIPATSILSAISGSVFDGPLTPYRWATAGVATGVAALVMYCTHRRLTPKVEAAYQTYRDLDGEKPRREDAKPLF